MCKPNETANIIKRPPIEWEKCENSMSDKGLIPKIWGWPKSKLQYLGHLTRRVNSLEKTLMLEQAGEEGKRVTEDEMAGWHHQLTGHEFEQTL